MSRLYDRARRYGFWCEEMANPVAGMVSATLPRCQVLSIDNVAKYWAVAHGGHLLKAQDLPNVAPPFDFFWMEYEWPYATAMDNPMLAKVLGAADESLKRSLTIRNVGMFCSAVDGYTDPAFVRKEFGRNPGWETIRWVVSLMPFIERTKGKALLGPIGQTIIGVRDEGTLVGTSKAGDIAVKGIPFIGDAAMYTGDRGTRLFQDNVNLNAVFCNAVFLAITLMHCKNVKMLKNEPEEKPSRRHKKKHGFPLTTYKTLEIEPMKEILRREGKAEKVGLDRALHICRGHFKTFGGDKKLFGKHEGTYFWPQHIRGKESAGRVEKDYAVKAPSPGQPLPSFAHDRRDSERNIL